MIFLSFADLLTHAWNAFRYGDAYRYTKQDIGVSSGWKPDRVSLNLSNEQSFVAAVYNRIAVDVASVNFRHVRVDENERFTETLRSSLNDCLTTSANRDQSARAFIQDVVLSMIDEGTVAMVPTIGELNREGLYISEIKSMRTAQILEWYPEHVRVRMYDEKEGIKKETILPKSLVAIVENPFYAVMNNPNATLKRLIRKLNYLDSIDAQTSSGKLDLIIQLPYIIKTPQRQQQAEQRLQQIQKQLDGSKLGIAYADGTERIVQLNRPIENALLPQIEFLTKEVYSQLGLTAEIMNGTAGEDALNGYFTRTIEPFATAIAEAMRRTFLTKTARTQGQSVMYFRDPFKLSPMSQIADIADRFTRNEILSSNEVRAIIGFKPDDSPRSDELINKNIAQDPSGMEPMMDDGEMTEEDFQQAFADLDEVDANLDDLEAELGLMHYASPYYDPVKAHEYYMKHRELKKRKSVATLNDKGKEAARYVKEQLTSERKEKQQDVRDEANADVSSVKDQAARNIESAREKKKQQIENHKAVMNAKIDNLRASLKGLKGEEKAEQSEKVKGEIAGLREENKRQRDELNEEYKAYTARVRENRSSSISDIRDESSSERKRIKTRYDDKYIEELDRIRADPSMLKQKKASKSTRKSVLKKK